MILPIEILLGFAHNAQKIFVAVGIVSLIGAALGVVVFMCSIDEKDSEQAKDMKRFSYRIWKFFVPLCALSVLVTSIPSVDDIWKVRIGLIKLQLASPENIQKGAEEIARIGKKLECRYLGCDEEKTKEKK